MHHILAQALTLPGGGSIQGPVNESLFTGGKLTLGSIVSSALPLIFGFAGIGLLLMRLLALGLLFSQAQGTRKNSNREKAN